MIEEARKQANIESIIRKALPDVNADAKPAEVQSDWYATFFNKCPLVSDEQMQSVWANILAWEANAPGSYSKRTLSIVENLDKSDGERFEQTCSFAVRIEGELSLLIFEFGAPYSERGITTQLLAHLESIGLVSYDPFAGFRRCFSKRELTAEYLGTPFRIELNKNTFGKPVQMGLVLLTESGQQVSNLFDAEPMPDFLELLSKKWSAGIGLHRIIVSSADAAQ